MSSSEKTVLGRFVSACGMIAAGAFLLWLAVYLLQQIWIWLLIAVALVTVVIVVIVVVRFRRDRWFR